MISMQGNMIGTPASKGRYKQIHAYFFSITTPPAAMQSTNSLTSLILLQGGSHKSHSTFQAPHLDQWWIMMMLMMLTRWWSPEKGAVGIDVEAGNVGTDADDNDVGTYANADYIDTGADADGAGSNADYVGYQLDALPKVPSPATGEYDWVGWVNVETVDASQSQWQCQHHGWPNWCQSQHFYVYFLLGGKHLIFRVWNLTDNLRPKVEETKSLFCFF